MKQLIIRVPLLGGETGKGVKMTAIQTESFKELDPPSAVCSALGLCQEVRHTEAYRAALHCTGRPRFQGVEAFWPHFPSLL